MSRDAKRKNVQATAELNAENRVVDALTGENASKETKERFRTMLRNGELGDREIDLELSDSGGGGMPTLDIPGMPGAQMGMLNLNDMFGKAFGQKTKKKTMTVDASHEILIREEADKLLDEEDVMSDAISNVENNGIVFLDEIDKITARRTSGRRCQPRGRAARLVAANRRHHGVDETRAGENRSYTIYRVRRVPRLKTIRHVAGTAGPPADPGQPECPNTR